MGFSTFGANLAADAVSNAIAFLGDFSPVLGAVFGVAFLSLLLGVLSRFLPK